MKTKTASIFILTLLTFVACQKKEEENNQPGHSFTAMVNGLHWKAAETEASIYNKTILIIGKSADGSVITLSLNGDSIGNFGLNENSTSSGTYTVGTNKGYSSNNGPDAGGEVLVEELDQVKKILTGSFHFQAVRPSDSSFITISNGRFVDIPFESTPIGISQNTLTVKINSTNWSPSTVTGSHIFSSLQITAIDGDGVKTLSFDLPDDIPPGKFALNYFTRYKAWYITSIEKRHYAVRGDLEIVAHNAVKQVIEGKFNCYMEEHEGIETSNFTAGHFKITYD